MPARPYREPRREDAVDAAVAAHGSEPASLLPILQSAQSGSGYLTPGQLGATADALRASDAHVFGVASFYSMLSTKPRARRVVHVCDGPVCMMSGAEQVRAEFESAAAAAGDWCVERTSCPGLCDRAPAALVEGQPCGPCGDRPAPQMLAGWRGEGPSYRNALAGETRVTLARVGKIDPESLDDALSAGSYATLRDAVRRGPDGVLAIVESSGLQGRGGAGFPAGRKWRMVAEAANVPKYVVCNADESEPCAFKDRVLLEEDPHLVLEGMALCGWAVGAEKGIIYVRGEYETAARRLERAIAAAEERGLLGERAREFFPFRVSVHRGAGAYICGEETALLESLEGRRGAPRLRPPFPATNGLNGKPTVVNNVETLASVPAIFRHGAAWYRSLGTATDSGCKLYMVLGPVRRPGLFEAPLGLSVRQLIERYAGGMRPGSEFKMALTGGAAGTIIGPGLVDVPLGFSSYKAGVSLGAGTVLVADQAVSVARLLSWLLHFFEAESCGKCTPCREGTRMARALVDRLAAGKPRRSDPDRLAQLADVLAAASLCGLGQSAAWPLRSAMQHFPAELFAGEENARE
jgi:NADH-quinone oxidoreductase subunit F